MNENIANHNNDDEMNKSTYQAVMNFSTRVGLPLAIALTCFFTGLVMAKGVIISILAAIISYIVTYTIVKMFFSH